MVYNTYPLLSFVWWCILLLYNHQGVSITTTASMNSRFSNNNNKNHDNAPTHTVPSRRHPSRSIVSSLAPLRGGHTSTSSKQQQSLTDLAPGPACPFYLWDAMSALLYKWCRHLQADCIYEGRGGKKFVRIRPGSILQLLHPITKYSPDRCIFCGGCFRDHLTLWWSKKHLYSPFDQFVDEQRSRVCCSSKRQATSSSNKHNNNYHQPYVLEANFLLDESISPKKRAKMLQKHYRQRFSKQKPPPLLEVRSIMSSSSSHARHRLVYVVPKPQPGSSSKLLHLLHTVVFEICFASLSRVLFLEQQQQQGGVEP